MARSNKKKRETLRRGFIDARDKPVNDPPDQATQLRQALCPDWLRYVGKEMASDALHDHLLAIKKQTGINIHTLIALINGQASDEKTAREILNAAEILSSQTQKELNLA